MKRTSEASLAGWFGRAFEAAMDWRMKPAFQLTLTNVTLNTIFSGQYVVQGKRTGETAGDGKTYSASAASGYVPQVGDVVQMVFVDKQVGWLLAPITTSAPRFLGYLTAAGAPSSSLGPFNKGDYAFDSNGLLWVNAVAGVAGDWKTGPDFYRCFAYSNSAQSMGAAPAAGTVNLNATLFDPNNNFNTTTHAYTASLAGYYQANWGLEALVANNPEQFWTGIYVNGSLRWQGSQLTVRGGTTNDPWGSAGGGVISLNAGDSVTLGWFHSSGANALPIANGSQHQTYLSIAFLSSLTG